MVSQTLTSPNFNMFKNRLAHIVIKNPAFTCSVPLLHFFHWLPVKYRMFKISLLTYKTFHGKRHFIFIACLPNNCHSIYLDQTQEIVCQPLGSRPTHARPFHSYAPSLWNNLPLSVHSASSIATFKKHPKTHILDLSFLHHHVCTPDGPLMIRSCFIDFGGYWCYKKLID